MVAVIVKQEIIAIIKDVINTLVATNADMLVVGNAPIFLVIKVCLTRSICD